MLLKSIKMTVNNKKISFDFKNKRNIILSGTNKMNLICALEMLLSSDFNNNIATKDAVYGFNYADITDSILVFSNDSLLAGKGGRVVKQGNIPKIHCIRYTKNGTLRSYIFSDVACNASVGKSLTEYSSVLNDTDWFRLCATVNKFIGKNIVDIYNGKLLFNFATDIEYSEEAQKFIYLLFAECMLTPDDFNRVVLLNDIDLLDKSAQLKLLDYLDSMKNHSCCISTVNVSFDDISSKSNIALLSI